MRTLCTGLGTVVLAAAAFAAPAGAATIEVTTTSDTPAMGCTLREAVDSANDDGDLGGCMRAGDPDGDDTIDLDAGEYLLTGIAGEPLNMSGDLDVDEDSGESLTIVGEGADQTIINALNDADEDRAIEQLEGALGLQGIEITNGEVTGDGGAIQTTAGANLTLDEVDIGFNHAKNTAGDSLGGGIAYLPTSPASLTITQSVIRGNSASTSAAAATAHGGGIHVAGASGSSITDTIVENNIAAANVVGPTGARGGGINISLVGDTLAITRTIVRNNHADVFDVPQSANGGGIQIEQGTARVESSVIHDNFLVNGDADGGGINNLGTLVLLNSTVHENHADVPFGEGGGVRAAAIGNTRILQSTIAHNTAGAGGDAIEASSAQFEVEGSILHAPSASSVCSGSGITFSSHTVAVGSSCMLAGVGDLETTDTALMLGGATDVGGPLVGVPLPAYDWPLSAFLPARTSPAVDRVPESACVDELNADLLVDEFGAPRPTDGDGDGVLECDSGARELDTFVAPPPQQPPAGGSTPSVPALVLTPAPAAKKCKKGRKLRKGKCVKKEEEEEEEVTPPAAPK